MRLVQNDEGVVERAPAHKGQWRNFELVALECFLHLVKPHQLIQGVVQRAQVGVHLLHHIARQKTQALAGFHRRARQHDALHIAALQRIHRTGHRQPGFTGACRADTQGDVVASNGLQICALIGTARAQIAAAGGELRIVVWQRGIAVARQHQLHHGGCNRPCGLFVQRLQHLHGALRLGLGAIHLELLVPVRDFHVQRTLDGAQVLVQRAAQMRQTGIVEGGKAVTQNHADNPRFVACLMNRFEDTP